MSAGQEALRAGSGKRLSRAWRAALKGTAVPGAVDRLNGMTRVVTGGGARLLKLEKPWVSPLSGLAPRWTWQSRQVLTASPSSVGGSLQTVRPQAAGWGGLGESPGLTHGGGGPTLPQHEKYFQTVNWKPACLPLPPPGGGDSKEGGGRGQRHGTSPSVSPPTPPPPGTSPSVTPVTAHIPHLTPLSSLTEEGREGKGWGR